MRPLLRRWPVWLLLLGAAAAAIGLGLAFVFYPQPLPAAGVSPLPAGCFQAATARLAQAGLSGRLSLRGDGTLVVDLSLPSHWPIDQAPQAVWIAFDAVAAMPSTCPYQQLEVLVPTAAMRLRALVPAADLLAWTAGDIEDDDLVERVLYVVEPLPSPAPW